jgi:hypothetical protein
MKVSIELECLHNFVPLLRGRLGCVSNSAHCCVRPVTRAVLFTALFANTVVLFAPMASAQDAACVYSAAIMPAQALSNSSHPAVDAPRVELAARFAVSGSSESDAYKRMRENAARELAGRPDGVGTVNVDEFHKADDAIARQMANCKYGFVICNLVFCLRGA